MLVNIPKGAEISHHYSLDGTVAVARQQDGRMVLDIKPADFKALVNNRKTGLLWLEANPHALNEAYVAAPRSGDVPTAPIQQSRIGEQRR